MKDEGRFGEFGGYYVSELLLPCLEELEAGWLEAGRDPTFAADLKALLADFAGRPTPLYRARQLEARVGATVYLKREDLLHGGAHKTNNTVGQALLAKRMNKTKLIAETGAGQHGVATAMAGAALGLDVKIFMGAKDVERQRPNVTRMGLFGAEVVPVDQGSASLKDAINEAMRYWTANLEDTFYVFGTAAGPHPYPALVRDLQRVIGEEIREQIRQKEGRLPSDVIACVGGGSNAIGAFAAFLDDPEVRLWGAEPGGRGADAHGAAISFGTSGCLHGSISYVLQDEGGQVRESHSISAGLDYPGVGPEHAHLAKTGRVTYRPVLDADALDAFRWLAKHEGILCALESAHAVALALQRDTGPDDLVVINVSGRGDKDVDHVLRSTDG
jgi:tryptophan synthase beta chain